MMTGTPAAFKTYRVQAYVVSLIMDFLIDGRRIGQKYDWVVGT